MDALLLADEEIAGAEAEAGEGVAMLQGPRCLPGTVEQQHRQQQFPPLHHLLLRPTGADLAQFPALVPEVGLRLPLLHLPLLPLRRLQEVGAQRKKVFLQLKLKEMEEMQKMTIKLLISLYDFVFLSLVSFIPVLFLQLIT